MQHTDSQTGSIIQGRLDLVCPPRTAWDLHQAMPQSKLYMIPAAGHASSVSDMLFHCLSSVDTLQEPGINDKLIEVCNEYAKMNFT